MEDEKITLNIPIYEILFGIGILMIIIGTMMCAGIYQFMGIWLDTSAGVFVLPIGVGLTYGYITRKILQNEKNSYLIGVVLGVIGVIIAVCIRVNKTTISNNENINKYKSLEQLAKLKESKTITELEFETEKSKILKGE